MPVRAFYTNQCLKKLIIPASTYSIHLHSMHILVFWEGYGAGWNAEMPCIPMFKCLVFQVATPSIHASRTSRRKTCASNISRSPRVMGVFWAIANHRGNEYAQQADIEGGAQGFPFSFFWKTCQFTPLVAHRGRPRGFHSRFLIWEVPLLVIVPVPLPFGTHSQAIEPKCRRFSKFSSSKLFGTWAFSEEYDNWEDLGKNSGNHGYCVFRGF